METKATKGLGHRDRLKERFLTGQQEARTEEALLELLLSYAIPLKDVQPLAKELILRYGSIDGVLSADTADLYKVDGIKNHTAVLVKLVDWIRTRHMPRPKGKPPARSSMLDQSGLFAPEAREEQKARPEKTPEKIGVPRARDRSDVQPKRFSNAVLKEAIALLPDLPDSHTVDEVRSLLRDMLHFSAQTTRVRYANYIVSRMFPSGDIDMSLISFARHYRVSQELKDVCFYRFCKAEPLMPEIVRDLLLPALGTGVITRRALRDYLGHRFPTARDLIDPAKAVVDALTAGGLAKADKTSIHFSYRDVLIPSFAFVLYSEFPEPGMYDIALLEQNNTVGSMLWNPDRILPALYELRNRNLVAKVSEIDNVRQFTIKWTLEQMVASLVNTATEAR